MEQDPVKISDLRSLLDGMRRDLEELERGEAGVSTPELRRRREEIARREQALRAMGVDNP
jgi:hypothetical protein